MMMWILLGLVLWVVASLPLAVVVGRAFAAGDVARPGHPLLENETPVAA